MDGLALAVLRRDWEARWARARVEKIHQPGERDLVLTLRVPGGSHRVLLSADRTHPRVHELLRQRPTNPEEPPAFCRVLRKRLEGARLTAIRQQGWDRVLELHFETVNELGDRVCYALVCELTGRHSNLLLCEVTATGSLGRIVDSIVHVPPDLSRVRPVLPGLPYEPPPPLTKTAYDRLQADDVVALRLEALAGKARVRALAGAVAGMGGVTAAEVLHRARSLAADDVLAALQALFHTALHATEPASLGLDPLGWPVAAAPFQLTSLPRWQATASLDEALDAYYAQALQRTQLAGLAQRLQSALARQQDRLLGKRAKLLEQQAESQNHEQDRVCGELLLAYAHTVPHGAQVVELPDLYHEGAPLSIALDPALSAVANAQRYFRLASKKKRALPVLERELAAVASELQYLAEAQVFLRDANPAQLEALAAELAAHGILPTDDKRAQRWRHARREQRPDAYWSVDGLLIRVGRNHTQNDRLTLRWSQPDDVWLHAKDQPGSHVVVAAEGRPVPATTLHEAALLAAYFSNGRSSANVPVDYTLVKHVWKPNGARPGLVLYDHQRTLYVTPDREQVEQILARRAAETVPATPPGP